MDKAIGGLITSENNFTSSNSFGDACCCCIIIFVILFKKNLFFVGSLFTICFASSFGCLDPSIMLIIMDSTIIKKYKYQLSLQKPQKIKMGLAVQA